ncbi:MAG: prephenate dehydrogenase/arogenate dehydrogenase family protein [Chloroflexi bacterium]|nr:prephenate dehydrogenase/arogenate dehydrogenase family protein [Chloroflexota bacterium]
MGGCLGKMFGDLGHAVMIADRDTQLTNEQAAKAADVVVISVPIEVTEEVVRQVGPHVRDGALLMDVTSIKAGPLEAMLESTAASVVGTHPLFGPSVHSLQGQRIVLLLNENTVQAPTAYTFTMVVGDQFAGANLVEVPLTEHVESGSYLVRIRVDGAVSPLEVESGQYSGPLVDIP